MSARTALPAALLAPPALAAAAVMAPAFGPGALLPLAGAALAWTAARLTPRERRTAVLVAHLGLWPGVTAGVLLPGPFGLILAPLAPAIVFALVCGRGRAAFAHWLLWSALYWSAWGVVQALLAAPVR